MRDLWERFEYECTYLQHREHNDNNRVRLAWDEFQRELIYQRERMIKFLKEV